MTCENTIPMTTANEGTTTLTEATREPERYLTPAVDIFETKTGLTVIADLPGIHQEDVHLSVDNDVLTIKGTVDDANTEPEYWHKEFNLVSYFRQFTLGQKIDQGRIGAEFKNGSLTVTLPFAEAAQPRRIEVRVLN
jgi:HSP20 family molecular chaperone IbpA